MTRSVSPCQSLFLKKKGPTYMKQKRKSSSKDKSETPSSKGPLLLKVKKQKQRESHSPGHKAFTGLSQDPEPGLLWPYTIWAPWINLPMSQSASQRVAGLSFSESSVLATQRVPSLRERNEKWCGWPKQPGVWTQGPDFTSFICNFWSCSQINQSRSLSISFLVR